MCYKNLPDFCWLGILFALFRLFIKNIKKIAQQITAKPTSDTRTTAPFPNEFFEFEDSLDGERDCFGGVKDGLILDGLSFGVEGDGLFGVTGVDRGLTIDNGFSGEKIGLWELSGASENGGFLICTSVSGAGGVVIATFVFGGGGFKKIGDGGVRLGGVTDWFDEFDGFEGGFLLGLLIFGEAERGGVGDLSNGEDGRGTKWLDEGVVIGSGGLRDEELSGRSFGDSLGGGVSNSSSLSNGCCIWESTEDGGGGSNTGDAGGLKFSWGIDSMTKGDGLDFALSGDGTSTTGDGGEVVASSKVSFSGEEFGGSGCVVLKNSSILKWN